MPTSPPNFWRPSRTRTLTLDQPRVIGILNITPDSFSDAGEHERAADALRAAERMLAAGADALDIGGESTRPGAQRIPANIQIARVIPAIAAIRAKLGDAFPITVDTTLSEVATAAINAGADAINDVSAGLDDPLLFSTAAKLGAGVILMHRLRTPASDEFSTNYAHPPSYNDQGGVVRAVRAFLTTRAAAAEQAGIPRDRIVLDPGLGFGKSVEDNLHLITASDLAALGYPILSALSRKSFTARAAHLPDATPPKDRVAASVGLSVVHLCKGQATLFRVHDVREHVQALRAAWSVRGGAV